MKNNYGVMFPGIIMVIIGLLTILFHSGSIGPILITIGLMLILYDIFKNGDNKAFYGIFMVASLVLMFIFEYFLVPIQNTAFYFFLLIMAIGSFISFYFQLHNNPPTIIKTILLWIGHILLFISVFSLMGIIFKDFTAAIMLGTICLIILILVGIGFYIFSNQMKGYRLLKKGKYEESIKYLNKALESQPKNSFLWYNKGKALKELLQYTKALECFDNVLGLDPNHEPALKAKEEILKLI
ncbi:tetratricopeptide repeat protein [Methanobacterium oryzae]|uniref:tetratricopeptide repeat protein n=1 Tax=Methanobacterium oryzae TaxID=69540 RepID=UPI003D191E72